MIDKGKKTILIVDDESDAVDIIRIIVESDGYKTISAYSGEEALELLSKIERLPDLLLLDIMMPTMEGWDVLEIMKRDERLAEIPVAMLTAKTLTPEIVQGNLADDIENYITKPFTREGLLRKIEDILTLKEETKNEGELIKKHIDEKTAEDYKMLVERVARHKKLLIALRESLRLEEGEILRSAGNVIKAQERMLEISRKRIEGIKLRLKKTMEAQR